MTPLSPIDLLVAAAEPTRLRILNCLAAAPLFVSDLQSVLALPQPTVSRHLTVLKKAGLVRDTPIAQYVLYRIRPQNATTGRLIQALLEALSTDEVLRLERHRALDRSRAHARSRAGVAGRGGRAGAAGPDGKEAP